MTRDARYDPSHPRHRELMLPCCARGDHAPKAPVSMKPKKQLDHEIATALAVPAPELAALFADPAARRVFADEMRLALYKKKAAEDSAALLAAKPFDLKRRTPEGHREFVGRVATEAEARAKADKIGGWVEHNGKVIYGERK